MSTQAPALVEYRRSGGIAGREDQLVVRNDGTARLSRRGTVSEFTVSADTLARIRSLVDSLESRGLRGDYLPAQRGADLFEYVVIYRDRRIRTMDTAVPPELQPLIQLCSGLLNRSP